MIKINSSIIDATPDKGLLNVDPRWKESIEPITLFKDAIDRVIEAGTKLHEKMPVSEKDRLLLAEQGIHAALLRARYSSGSASGQVPMNFIGLILGPFCEGVLEPVKQVYVPPWTTLGWKSKHFGKKEYEADEREKLNAREEIEKHSGKPASGTCFNGIPLFIAGEGKNRCSFHRQYELDQLIWFYRGIYPNPCELLMQPVLSRINLVMLHWTKENTRLSTLLQFPKLSVKLLEMYGVKWSPTPIRAILPFTKVHPSLAVHGEIARPISWTKKISITFGKCRLRDQLHGDH